MEYRGLFECINGLLIGRSAAPDETDPNRLSYYECLRQYLGDLPIPVMIDLDIGHKPPNLTLINGALASVSMSAKSEEHIGSIIQTLAP